MADMKTGTMLGERYRLNEKIGRGGMAEVWTADDDNLGRTVAVKIMLPQFAADQNFARRFKREAAAAATLQNPYIVNVYDWGHDGDTQYIVMEYVPGEDLKAMIDEHGPVTTKTAARIGSQVCQALAAAHHQDIIHRDIKPQNIMVKPDGNIKVMDFGIARAKNSTDQKTKMVLGTAHYVSPEQAQGLELTAASDIYSLGIVLYEITSGTLPFDGDDAVSVAMKQVEETPRPLSEVADGIDPGFEAIVMKCLEKKPEDRFMTAIELGHALDDYVNGSYTGDDFTEAETSLLPPMQNADATRVMPARSDAVKSSPMGSEASRRLGDDEAKNSPNRSKKILIASIAAAVVAVLLIALGVSSLTPVSVPDVVNMPSTDAAAAIEQAGLEVGDQEEVSSKDVQKGNIVSSDPAGGTPVKRGTTINLQVSSGPEQVTVPDISNMTEDEAVKALSDAGLNYSKGDSRSSSSVAEGHVLSQTPSVGATVDEGTTVTYVLSSGANTVYVPDLSGMTEDEAIKELGSIGLKGTVGKREASDTVEEGKIIGQNPSANIKVEEGTKVTITVSTGAASVKVPSLTGFTQARAKSELANVGLALGSITEEYTDNDDDKGTIIEQSLEPQSSAKKGATVDVIISKGMDPALKQQSTSESTSQSDSSATTNIANQNANATGSASNSAVNGA